jgi:hypothetical protein
MEKFMSFMNPLVENRAEDYFEKYHNAQPYKHIIVDDFLELANLARLLDEFPAKGSKKGLISDYGGNGLKAGVTSVRANGPAFCEWDDYLRSPTFSTTMSRITGIEDLIYDKEHIGAGTHENFSGYRNNVHIDYNYHPNTKYHRRFNLIIYISKDWKNEYGGHISVCGNGYNPDDGTYRSYPCLFNRAIIFETTEHSWHGVESIDIPPELEQQGYSRKSLSVYMYTKDRPKEETAEFHETIYLPGLSPTGIREGNVLGSDDVAEIKKFVAATRNLISGLYSYQAKLLQRVHSQQALNTSYSRNYSLPFFGVKDIKFSAALSDPAGWIGSEFTCRLFPSHDSSSIKIQLAVNQAVALIGCKVCVDSSTYDLSLDSVGNTVLELNETLKEGTDVEFSISLKSRSERPRWVRLERIELIR